MQVALNSLYNFALPTTAHQPTHHYQLTFTGEPDGCDRQTKQYADTS